MIHPRDLFPVKPEEFREIDTEEWGRIALHGTCRATEGCGGALEVVILGANAKIPCMHLKLYCPECDKVQLGQKKGPPGRSRGVSLCLLVEDLR